MEPADLKIRADHDLGAVVVQVPDADVELVLSFTGATDLIIGLVKAIDRVWEAGHA
jgi:hypothetical protein